MPTWQTIWEWVLSGLVQNVVWVVAAILFVQFVQKVYENRRYGGWRVIVQMNEKGLVDREISPGKLKEILEEPSEMSVFIKGVASPYAWINCDVLTEGKRLGLFMEEREQRRLVIDLDKNPKVQKNGRQDASQEERHA
jgi:hypothetical protein